VEPQPRYVDDALVTEPEVRDALACIERPGQLPKRVVKALAHARENGYESYFRRFLFEEPRIRASGGEARLRRAQNKGWIAAGLPPEQRPYQ
jgi:hypothetical protein